jgi:hypothetical protein
MALLSDPNNEFYILSDLDICRAPLTIQLKMAKLYVNDERVFLFTNLNALVLLHRLYAFAARQTIYG